jgi:hypothetical protein
MRVKDLQLFLSKFTESDAGGRQGNAVSNAVIMVEISGRLHEIRRMEVHENAEPVIVGLGKMRSAHRLVLKTVTESKILMPEKLRPDY